MTRFGFCIPAGRRQARRCGRCRCWEDLRKETQMNGHTDRQRQRASAEASEARSVCMTRLHLGQVRGGGKDATNGKSRQSRPNPHGGKIGLWRGACLLERGPANFSRGASVAWHFGTRALFHGIRFARPANLAELDVGVDVG